VIEQHARGEKIQLKDPLTLEVLDPQPEELDTHIQGKPHVPGGQSCGDTVDNEGRCVEMVDGEDGLTPVNCGCECHEEE
jgi:hypothetical protein